MLGKGDFVGVIGVGLVAVDGLGLVGILCGRDDLDVVGGLADLGCRAGLLKGLLGAACAKVGGSGAGHGVSERRGVLKAAELGRGVHLRRLDRVGRLGAAGGAVACHGLPRHGAGGLFGQGKRVEEGAGGGGWRRAKVEDPDNVEHGEQDEAGSGGLTGANVGVDEVVDAGAGENEAGGKVAAEGNVVGLDGVGGDDDKNANVEEEGIHDGPPGEFRKALAALNLGDNARYEADEPGEHADRESREGKGVTDDVAHLEAAAAIVSRMLHFLD